MPNVAFRTAIRDALDEELAADERVILFGEDIAVAGGVFATTTGLYDKYGAQRVFDTPISELALTGAAFGSAVHGLRPVLEIMFGDFLTLAMDSIVNQSTKYWFLTQERVSVPLVIRSVVGAVNGEVGRLGEASVVREGTDVTLVTAMKGVHDALEAADELQKDGISVEVVDLRTLRPFDLETVSTSVQKTNRIVVV